MMIISLSHDTNQPETVYNRSENVSRCHISESERRCEALFAIVGGELAAGTCFPPPYVTSLPLPSDSGFHGETLSVSCRICYFGHSVAVHWSADRRVHSALHSASRRSKGSYSGLCRCCCSGCCSDGDDDSDAAVRPSRTRSATWLHDVGGRTRKKSRTASNRRHVALENDGSFTHVQVTVSEPNPPAWAPTGSRSVWMDLLQRERHKGGTLVVVADGKFAAVTVFYRLFLEFWLFCKPRPAPVRLPGNSWLMLEISDFGELGRARIHSTLDKWEFKRTMWLQDHVIKGDTNKAAKILSKNNSNKEIRTVFFILAIFILFFVFAEFKFPRPSRFSHQVFDIFFWKHKNAPFLSVLSSVLAEMKFHIVHRYISHLDS